MPRTASPQSFGQGVLKMKRSVSLHRKLPATVHLKEGTISVKVASRDQKNLPAVQKLADTLQTELLKYNNQFKIDDTKPDVVIGCNITDLIMPGVKIVARVEPTPVQVGNKIVTQNQTHQYQEVTGSMTVAYDVKDIRSGKVLDADNLTAKYNEEFDAGGNKTDNNKKIQDVFKTNPFKKKSAEEKADETAPTAPQLQQILVGKIVQQVAARVTNTDETVEVKLARGPALEQYNEFAEKGLWNRMLEPLETMKPFDTKQEDSFRLYNIGVAYEALAYQADDNKAAKKYLDEAAINYGKAVDDNARQKEFLDAQNRISTAQAHYAKLGSTQVASNKSTPPPTSSASTSPAKVSSSTNSDAKTTSPANPTSDALTNAQVIEFVKQGLDEENLVALINDAPKVNFDLTTNGVMDLVRNGVKGKVLTTMRTKAHATSTRRTSTPPTK